MLPKYTPKRLAPDELIPGLEVPVSSFWAWAYSDVMENTQRATYAEFLVAAALGITDGVRVGWLGYDLAYRGKKIEVKASAYLQSWNQRKHSRVEFSVAKRQQLDEDGITYVGEPIRAADCYVFCLFVEKDPSLANVLDPRQWTFYVVDSGKLEQRCGTAMSASLATIKDLSAPHDFAGLREAIELASGF